MLDSFRALVNGGPDWAMNALPNPILLAVLAIIPAGLDAAGKELYFSDKINLSGVFSIGSIGGLVCFAGILLSIYFFATKDSKKKSN